MYMLHEGPKVDAFFPRGSSAASNKKSPRSTWEADRSWDDTRAEERVGSEVSGASFELFKGDIDRAPLEGDRYGHR